MPQAASWSAWGARAARRIEPGRLDTPEAAGFDALGVASPPSGDHVGQRLLGVAIVNYRGATDTAGLVRSIVGTLRGPDIGIVLAIVDNSDEADELRR